MTPTKDPVDLIKEQWKLERPELSTNAMETLGRLKRCSVLYQPFLESVFKKFDLSTWEFDVLASLRRSGKPYRLSPTELFSSLMVTSGTMTNRLKNLEKRKLIKRVLNPNDARSNWVALTPGGLKMVDKALVAHVDNMENLLTPLTDEERDVLNRSLKKLLFVFENQHKDNQQAGDALTPDMHKL